MSILPPTGPHPAAAATIPARTAPPVIAGTPRRRTLLSLAGLAGLGALAWAAAPRRASRRLLALASPSPLHPAPPPPRPARWPDPELYLSAPALSLPPPSSPRRVYLDPGHGAPNNRGNTSCRCELEESFTSRTARAVADRLEATGAFEVRLSREGERAVDYRERVEAAQAWGAAAFVSLHSDVRGQPERHEGDCPVSLLAPGFSVLWSDEGDPALAGSRLSLARAVARRMEEAGFLAYGGGEYTGLYAPDAAQRGVFVDRHEPDKRIFVLRRPTMPAILVETHHALDPREVARWEEPATLDAFATALAAALLDTLEPGDP